MNLEESNQKIKKHDQGVADLEKVTDYREDIEISNQSIQNAANIINRSGTGGIKLSKSGLLNIIIKPEDVNFIMTEMEVSKTKAEKLLKEHDGDLSQTLLYLIDNYV